MIRPNVWLRPPGPLLAMVGATTLVSSAGLLWMGWRTARSERAAAVEEQRRQLEDRADHLASAIRSTIGLATAQLGVWAVSPPPDEAIPEGAILLLPDAPIAVPARRLLYSPFPAMRSSNPSAFTEAENLEFQANQMEAAAGRYRALAEQGTPDQRAGALLRLGRVCVKLGNANAAAGAYRSLATMTNARAAGVPADFLGRHLIAMIGRNKAEASRLLSEMESGRWPLSRGQFVFYWSELADLAGRAPELPAAAALAEATAAAWERYNSGAVPAGVETTWHDGQPWLLIWHTEAGRRAVLITPAEAFLSSAGRGMRFHWKAMDAEGRTIAGELPKTAMAAVRIPADSRLQWTLAVAAFDAPAGSARDHPFLAGLGAAIVFVLLAGYFIARSIRREAEVSRLQSDFVSAVSHEFRSPLASIRHLSEMLALGRVAGDARRERYYATLVTETSRLQRLVESLLDFGRMQAGARQEAFSAIDASALTRQVVDEFEAFAGSEGRRIEVSTGGEAARVEGNAEALGLALRNLIDNALKYSPGCETIWVSCEQRDGLVAIAVRDEGFGIADGERRKIFTKFVRGAAAEAANTKGTGLGLAMVAQVVQSHRGTIELESEPGKGSIFTLLLPVLKS